MISMRLEPSKRNTYDGTIVQDSIGFLCNARPFRCFQAKLLVRQISHNSLNTTLRFPILIPYPSTFATLSQSLHGVLLGLGTNQADDPGNAFGPLGEEIVQDERSQETSSAGQKYGQLLGGKVGRKRCECLWQCWQQDIYVFSVVHFDSRGRPVRRSTLIPSQTEILVSQRINLLGQSTDSRTLKDEAEGNIDDKSLSQFENESRGENGMPSEIEEVVLSVERRGRNWQELEPDIVDSLLSR